MKSFFWQMAFGELQINLANFTIHIGQISSAQNVGEIEWQFFCQSMCGSNYLLGAQSLGKSTPSVLVLQHENKLGFLESAAK